MGRKISVFLFIFIMVMMMSSCFAGTSYKQINEVLNNLGYGDMPVNSDVTSALNKNVAVFFTNYNKDNKPTRVTILYDDYPMFPIYLQKQGSNTSTYYRLYSTTNTGWLYAHYYNINDKQLSYGGKLYTRNGAYATMTSFSNYSTDYSLSEYATYNFQKRILIDSLIYLPTNQTLNFESSSGKDIFYKWNGKWSGKSGNNIHPAYGGKFVFSSEYLYYYYDSELQEPLSEIVIDLNGYYPSSLSRLGEDIYPQNDGDTHKYIVAQANYDYSYYYVRLYDLIQMLDEDLIYRMQATSSISGDNNICTSEFFGTSKWISNNYIIRNLKDYIKPSDDIVQEKESGDKTGIDLSGIESGIGNINNSINGLNNNINNFISGDITKTSGEIERGFK